MVICTGFVKVHKACIDNFTPFQPFLCTLGKPTYKYAKFLAPIINVITTNETVDVCIKLVFKHSESIEGFGKNDFKNMLSLATTDS